MTEKKRALMTGLFHETNTYVPPGGMEQFTRYAGLSALDQFRNTGSVCGGYIDFCEKNEIEVVPTGVIYFGNPCGLILKDSYQAMKQDILNGVREAGRLDLVMLFFHGAAFAEGVDDPEGDIVRSIRDILGKDVVIVALGMDLHGKYSEKFDGLVNWVSCVHNYPHTDFHERVLECMEYIPRVMNGSIHPARHVEYLPLVAPSTTTMGDGIGAKIRARIKEIQKKPGILDFCYFYGFPFGDSRYMGGYVVATTDNDLTAAKSEAQEFARWVWSLREQLNQRSMTIEEAVQAAVQQLKADGHYRERPRVDLDKLASDDVTRDASITRAKEWAYGFVPDADLKGPVVIHDTADNPGGGTAGRSTHLLRRLMEENPERTLFFGICDPGVAKKAHVAGVGGVIDIELGGGGEFDGEPVKAKALVKTLSDGRLTTRSVFVDTRYDVGPTARIIVGDFEIIVTSAPYQAFDNTMALLGGVDLRDYRIVALKSSTHFRAYFTPMARSIITADGPGGSSGIITTFKPTHMRMPVYPFNPDATYP